MSGLTDTLRKVTGRERSDVTSRLSGLDQAVEAGRGRLPDREVDEAARVVERAGDRLRLSADHTVVALAGATGSGKSSTFNALTGLDLAAVGVRRPTTSWALACAWGPEGASEILDWLGIPPRHQVNRASSLDVGTTDDGLEGLVLLDLPDHDSTEVSHHLEVDRLVELVDMIVWVVDPQKYADHALHHRYLRPYASHAEVMTVVLNHADELPADRRAETVADLRRLLAADGLPDVPVLAVSATTGLGMDDLREHLRALLRRKGAVAQRVEADVAAAAEPLSAQTGDHTPPDVRDAARGELLDACAEAAGVPVVVDAIEQATLVRGRQATGWPVTSWLAKMRPDPLKRFHLDRGDASGRATVSRSSLPEATPVQRARVDTAVRGVADQVSQQMPRPWADAIRRASTSRLGDVNDELDRSVASTDLGVTRDPGWWSAVRVVQWVLFAAAVAGALWLLALATFSYLQLPQPGSPDVGGFPLPTLLLLGGVVLGLLVAALARWATARSARARARKADRRLREGIAEVTDRLVVEPVAREVEAYVACRDGLRAARAR